MKEFEVIDSKSVVCEPQDGYWSGGDWIHKSFIRYSKPVLIVDVEDVDNPSVKASFMIIKKDTIGIWLESKIEHIKGFLFLFGHDKYTYLGTKKETWKQTECILIERSDNTSIRDVREMEQWLKEIN